MPSRWWVSLKCMTWNKAKVWNLCYCSSDHSTATFTSSTFDFNSFSCDCASTRVYLRLWSTSWYTIDQSVPARLTSWNKIGHTELARLASWYGIGHWIANLILDWWDTHENEVDITWICFFHRHHLGYPVRADLGHAYQRLQIAQGNFIFKNKNKTKQTNK